MSQSAGAMPASEILKDAMPMPVCPSSAPTVVLNTGFQLFWFETSDCASTEGPSRPSEVGEGEVFQRNRQEAWLRMCAAPRGAGKAVGPDSFQMIPSGLVAGTSATFPPVAVGKAGWVVALVPDCCAT